MDQQLQLPMSSIPSKENGLPSTVPTPIIRALEDPIGHHIIPSRIQVSSSSQSSALIPFPSSSTTLMLPPPSRKLLPTTTIKEQINQNRITLTEDAYQKGLEHIIERDYYPSLSKLSNQLEWLQALETRDPQIIAYTKNKLLSIQQQQQEKKTSNYTDTSSSLSNIHTYNTNIQPEWGGSQRTTPSINGSRLQLVQDNHDHNNNTDQLSQLQHNHNLENDDDNISITSWSEGISSEPTKKRIRTTTLPPNHDDNESIISSVTTNLPTTNTNNPDIIESMSLINYQNAFTTEDNKHFLSNIEKKQDQQRRKQWWAHIPVTNQKKVLMIHDQSANRIIPEHKSMQEIIQDSQTSNNNNSNHHVRNSLFFLPSLNQSNEISKVQQPKYNIDLPLLIEDNKLQQQALKQYTKQRSIDDSILLDIDHQLRRYQQLEDDTHSTLTKPKSTTSSSSSDSIISNLESSTLYKGMDLIIPSINIYKSKLSIPNKNTINYQHTRLINDDNIDNLLSTNDNKSTIPSTLLSTSSSSSYVPASHNTYAEEYPYVSTPALVSGMNMTPIITWGEISGTPVMLDPPVIMSQQDTASLSSTASSSTTFATRAEDIAKEIGIDLKSSPSTLFTTTLSSQRQQQRDNAHEQLVDKIMDARKRRQEKAGVINIPTNNSITNSTTPLLTAGLTPNTVSLTKAHLRQAIAETQLLKSGTTPSLTSNTHQTTTPLFASSMTPSAWNLHNTNKQRGTSAESIISSRSSQYSSTSRQSTASSTAASMLRSLPPAARKMATSIAQNVIKTKGLDTQAGDLSGVFSNNNKKRPR